jgi:hypothetical protein
MVGIMSGVFDVENKLIGQEPKVAKLKNTVPEKKIVQKKK